MKKILTIFPILIFFLFFSCNSSSETEADSYAEDEEYNSDLDAELEEYNQEEEVLEDELVGDDYTANLYEGFEDDDDNDGILDVDDLCPWGFIGWSSSTFSDWDSDGCSDLDEDMDDDRDIKRKKLAFKEEVRKAKDFLSTLKDKYYDEVKLGSRLAPEQQKAVEFFNRYNQEQSEVQAIQQKQVERFKQETEKVFSQDFKGFDFKVGENKYRFNVKDVAQTKEVQSDVLKALGGFLDENNMIKDAVGYHKALFAASNPDKIANHFYEQGKADAIKNSMAKAKNIDMDPRGSHEKVTSSSGFKVKAVSGDGIDRLRIKMKQ